MHICTCNNLESTEFKIIFEYHGSKASPILSRRGLEYINNTWPQHAGTMVYLLSEEMHFQCMNIRKEWKEIGDGAYISNYIACPIHNIIKLSKPVTYEYHKVKGIPCDVYKQIPTIDHPDFIPLDQR